MTTATPTPLITGGRAEQIVTAGFVSAQDYADTAVAAANAYLAQFEALANSLTNIPDVDVDLDILSLDLTPFNSLIGTVPTSPTNSEVFTEIPYSSSYLNDLRTQLDAWVVGEATGIDAVTEQAIYDRARAREITLSNRKAMEATRTFAARGFSKPPGALSIELQDAVQEAQNNGVTQSRDIMIKQADLEQTNRRFAFEQAWKVEEKLISYLDQQMNRALEKIKVTQSFLVELFQAQVSLYGAGGQVYAAKTGAYTSVFKSEIDEQVAEGNLRIESAKANVQSLIQQATILVEAIKGGAQVSAQLAASALSSVNLAAHIQHSDQNSASNSSSNSASDSTTTDLTV